MTSRLSIIIPTYNRPTLLPRAVVSALRACPQDAEVIVVDDRSDTAMGALGGFAGDKRLQVFTNGYEKGAGGARNFGAAQASGTYLLFLDDDDELAGDYPARLLDAAKNSGAAFGFCTIAEAAQHTAGPDETTVLHRRKLAPGVIGHDIPLEYKTAGLGAGFWIRRSLFLDAGGIDPAQTVDEDTDLCCRLYGSGHQAWFDDQPGCIVYRGYDVAEGSAPQLTRSTVGQVEAQCYARTFERNEAAFGARSDDRWFMLRRALRMAARTGSDSVARGLLHDLQPFGWRVKGWLFWQMKRAGAKLR